MKANCLLSMFWALILFSCSEETKEQVVPKEENQISSKLKAGENRYEFVSQYDDFVSKLQVYGWLKPTEVYLNRSASKSGYNSVYGFNIPSGNQATGFKWNSGDTRTPNWWPQGITGFNYGDKKFIVVTWYGKEACDHKGSRISLVDITDMNNIKYRLILLVQKRTTQTSNAYTQLDTYRPVDIHAGGVAYSNNRLFIASTNLGIRVFNITNIIESDWRDESKCGVDDNGTLHALGYRYILPQESYYDLDGGEPFSCISHSYGSSTIDNRLVTGQYLTSGNPVLHSFIQKDDGYLDLQQNPEIISPIDKYGGPIYRVQGAFTKGGKSFIIHTGNDSYKGSTARLSKYEPGKTTVRYRWPHGAEDLYYDSSTDYLWCLTEYPTSKYRRDNRSVFAVKFSKYD